MTVVRCQCIWFSLGFAVFAMDLEKGFVLPRLFGARQKIMGLGVCVDDRSESRTTRLGSAKAAHAEGSSQACSGSLRHPQQDFGEASAELSRALSRAVDESNTLTP